jgi:hypothetical protein
MAWDIYGNDLRRGYCEIHPWVQEEYPCSLCDVERRESERREKERCSLREQSLYTEEEVKKLAFDFYYDMSRQMKVPENLISENETNFEEWFNQHKKK